jgi:carbohydrate-selective porin OprB
LPAAGELFLHKGPATEDASIGKIAYPATGLYYWGPCSKRPNDSFGIATGINRIAGNVRNAEVAYNAAHPGSGYGVQSNEWVQEIFYSFDIFHGANVQPDLQWIINPGGYQSATNEVVLRIQLSVPL